MSLYWLVSLSISWSVGPSIHLKWDFPEHTKHCTYLYLEGKCKEIEWLKWIALSVARGCYIQLWLFKWFCDTVSFVLQLLCAPYIESDGHLCGSSSCDFSVLTTQISNDRGWWRPSRYQWETSVYSLDDSACCNYGANHSRSSRDRDRSVACSFFLFFSSFSSWLCRLWVIREPPWSIWRCQILLMTISWRGCRDL